VNFNFSSIKNGTYRDAVTGLEVEVGNGSISFTVAPSSAGIYVLDGTGLIGELGAGFFQTDANGSQGGGGTGGGEEPAEIAAVPANPKAGESVKITYDGFLNDKSQVNLYWGYDSWVNPQTTPMSKDGDKWTVNITVPANAQNRIIFVFNDGA